MLINRDCSNYLSNINKKHFQCIHMYRLWIITHVSITAGTLYPTFNLSSSSIAYYDVFVPIKMDDERSSHSEIDWLWINFPLIERSRSMKELLISKILQLTQHWRKPLVNCTCNDGQCCSLIRISLIVDKHYLIA